MSDTDPSCCSGVLERGQIIPAFTLPAADGTLYSPWQFKQREHLLILIVSAKAQDTLLTYAQQYAALREEECTLLVIIPDPVITNLQLQERLHLPFPLLSDASGRVIARYTRWNSETRILAPSIILADRYGELQEQWIAENESLLPPIAEPLETLRYLNKLCTP